MGYDASLKAGLGDTQAFTNVEARVDLITDLGITDVPAVVELDARGAGCFVLQGDSTVTLAGTPANGRRIAEDGSRLIRVNSVADGYVVVVREAAVNGILGYGLVDRVA